MSYEDNPMEDLKFIRSLNKVKRRPKKTKIERAGKKEYVRALYFDGGSSREIAQVLNYKYKVDVSHQTVLNNIKKWEAK